MKRTRSAAKTRGKEESERFKIISNLPDHSPNDPQLTPELQRSKTLNYRKPGSHPADPPLRGWSALNVRMWIAKRGT